MANHNAVFTHRHASYEEEGAFRGNSFMRAAEGPVEHSKYIDPNLQTASSLSAPYHQCNIAPQPVQRYLNDRSKTAFFNADYTPKMQPNRAHRRPAMMPPVHAPCHARFPSPTSSHEPSTTGSVRSPPADTESYYDNNFPATPPDTTLLTSPYIHPAVHPFDYLNQQSLLNFTNMGPSQANNAYVNPIDVHATHHLEAVYEPEASIDFGLGTHASFAGYEDYDAIAPFDLDHGEQEQNLVVDAAIKRQSSPEGSQNVEQAEIRAAYSYPEMPAQVGDHEDDSEYESGTASASRRRKADDADDNNSDTDYKPTGKRNRPSTTGSFHAKPPAHRRRAVAAHQAAVSHTSGSPSKKKLKTVAPSGGAPGPSGKSASSLSGTGPLQCPHCKQSHFKDQAGLDNHVKKQHTRPYHCVFHFAGCTSTFATKNEWKRHVLSQHLLLHYWLCDEGACSKLTNTHATSSSSTSGSKSRSRSARNAASTVAATAGPSFGPPLPNGAIFNRKDLYTQHLRRMHTPPNIKKQAKQQQQQQQQQPASKAVNANTTPDWEAHLRNLASRAKKDRCALPTYMRCPAQGCEFEFRGPDAWDQRMEHVGRHLERAASGEDPHVEFGGAHDQTLIDWASNPAVAVIRRNASHQWELNNPLRPTAKATSTGEMILSMPGTGAGRAMADEEDQEDEIIVRDVIAMEHDPYGDVDADGEVDDLS